MSERATAEALLKKYEEEGSEAILKEYDEAVAREAREQADVRRAKGMEDAAEGLRQRQRAKEILRSVGIEMSIGACGCCGSPWVTMTYKGETLEGDCFEIDTRKSGDEDPEE